MTDDDLDALMRVARRVSGGEPLSSELMVNEGVPVSLRLLVAAITLSAADRPVNKKAVTTAAPAARSATYRDHADLLDGLVEWIPAFVASQLGLAGAPASVTELSSQLARANDTIAREREARVRAEDDLKHVAAYARELHLVLQPEHEALLRDKTAKVRALTVVRHSDGDGS